MRNLFLLSLLSLFMMASLGGQTPVQTSFIASAYADESADNSANTNDETDSNDNASTNVETDNNDNANNNDEANNTAEFHCPEGITTCYKNDGTEYNDINNLPATAAGPSGSGSGIAQAVKPVHFRSF